MKKTKQKTVKAAAKPAAKSAAKPTAKKDEPVKAKPAETKAAPAKNTPVKGGIDSTLVKQLAAILDETSLTEIEYDTGGVRIRVARHHGGGYAAPVAMPAPAAMAALPAPAAAAPAAAPADPASHPGTVKSPMVGVCYLLPEPGAAAFVKLGDNVSEGQTLCLIEAMKTFNPVRAPRAGKVVKIVVENGAPVEYGEPLLIIE